MTKAVQFQFDARAVTLADVLFTADDRYRVPRYQRPYAWTDDQASDLWSDVVEQERSAFIGSLILNFEHKKESGYVDIIDGQQRLLTVTILCAVLRDVARGIDKNRAALYQRQDIAHEGRSGEQAYRLKPGESCQVFFEQYVQDEAGKMPTSKPSTSEQRRIQGVYQLFHSLVTERVDGQSTNEAKVKCLDDIRDRIAHLVVVRMSITREDDAYEIFETVNARGVDLSVADLVKNLILSKLRANGGKDAAKDAWQEIIAEVEDTSTEVKKFLRYYWLSRYSFTPERRLYREIKKHISDWSAFLKDLQDAAQLYNALFAGELADFNEYKHAPDLYDAVLALRVMGVSQCFVFVMSLLRNYTRLSQDPIRLFRLIERFTFQYSAVCKLPGNKLEKVYAAHAKRLEDSCLVPDQKRRSKEVAVVLSSLERELVGLRPSREVFMDAFADLGYRNTEEGRRLVKYVLGRIDQSLRKTKEEAINFDKVNIEHVLPQKPGAAWGLKRREIKPYVNRLGNLTLLSKVLNSEAQNETIEKKLPTLEKSELPITQNLVTDIQKGGKEWNEASIDARQRQLAEMAFDTVWTF